jgi:hypothetical protein
MITVFPRIVSAETILFWRLGCDKYSREESIVFMLFAYDVIQVIQLKQINLCCIRLLQLGNIAKKISSVWLLKHFEQFQEHYKMANKSLFCFPLIQVRKLFKGGKLFKGRNY